MPHIIQNDRHTALHELLHLLGGMCTYYLVGMYIDLVSPQLRLLHTSPKNTKHSTCPPWQASRFPSVQSSSSDTHARASP
jgi:hypothetical protein